MKVETVPCDSDVEVSLTTECRPECPIEDETDRYLVTVEWQPDSETFEKWSLLDFVEEWDGREVSQEELADAVHCALEAADVRNLSVTVTDVKHTGMEVRSR